MRHVLNKINHIKIKYTLFKILIIPGGLILTPVLLCQSTTLYVGNMSFYTTEEQIYELFGKCGEVKRVVMGLDKFKRTPCGFCFLE